MEGLSWAVNMPNIGGQSLLQGIIIQGGLNSITIPAISQAIVFLGLLVIACIVFGWFWVENGKTKVQPQ